MHRWTSLAAVAVLLAALTACGRPQGSVADTRSLTSSTDLLPGDTCQYGGQQILTGVDLNGNGMLEANEVQQVSNVCADQPTGYCTTWTGDYYVTTADDWKNLADLGCTRIEGSLVISYTGVAGFEQELPLLQAGALSVISNAALTSLRLPHLTTLDGDLDVESNTLLAALDLPALTTVGGNVTLRLNAALTEISLPSLTSTGTLDLSSNSALIRFSAPALQVLGGSLLAEGGQALEVLSLPALTDVGADLRVLGTGSLTTLELQSLRRTVGEIYLKYAASLTTLDLPSLETAGMINLQFSTTAETLDHTTAISSLTEFLAPSLVQVNGRFSIFLANKLTRLELPALVSVAGDLGIWGPNPGGYHGDGGVFFKLPLAVLPSLSLPSLTTVGGTFTVSAQPALTTLEAPVLATAADIIFGGFPLLQELSLPELVAMRGYPTPIRKYTVSVSAGPGLVRLDLPKFSEGGVTVSGNPALTTLNLPAATNVALSVSAPALPSLDLPLLSTGTVSIGGCATLAELDLPSATSLRSLVLQDNVALASVQLPALTELGDLWVQGNGALTSLGLPALTQVTIRFSLDGNASLASLSLPLLAAVSTSAQATFNVTNHPLLTTLDVPQLTTVTGGFNVYNDPLLPNCQALAIYARLGPPQPPSLIQGNDMTAVCTP